MALIVRRSTITVTYLLRRSLVTKLVPSNSLNRLVSGIVVAASRRTRRELGRKGKQ